MRKAFTTKKLCVAGAIAGLYAALTLLLAPVSFGQGGAFQLRFSEALTLLPALSFAAVPGLTVGCFAANLLCGAPWQDIVFGTLATLLASLLSYRLRRNLWLAAAAPVICNTVIVGATLSALYGLPLFYAMLTVLPGEIAACFLLGVPLARGLQKLPALNDL